MRPDQHEPAFEQFKNGQHGSWSSQSEDWTPEHYQAYYYQQQLLYQQQMQYYYPTHYQQQMYGQLQKEPAERVTAPPKLSANQKRKEKLRRKKEELAEETKAIGQRWVRLECKQLVGDVQKLEERELKRKEKRKEKFAHLIEIHKELQKLREKMGTVDSTIGERKHLKEVMEKHNIRMGRPKKPSRIKQLAQLYKEKCAKDRTKFNDHQQAKKNDRLPEDGFITESEDEEPKKAELPISQATRDKATPITYSKVGKLTRQSWNDIELREWVDHMPSVDLQHKLLIFINKLAYQQAIKKLKQPLKFKKRVLSGFNEVSRTLTTINPEKRCRCLIVALNIRRNPFEEGSDAAVIELIEHAVRQNIPVLHCSTRSKLGRAFVGKFGPRLSVVSIVNYQGNEEQFEEILADWRQLKITYEQSLQPWLLLEDNNKRNISAKEAPEIRASRN